MKPILRFLGIFFVGCVLEAGPAKAQQVTPETVANWSAPLLWRGVTAREIGDEMAPGRSDELRPESAASLPTPALPLIGINPCRIADTRGNGFSGAYGPPSLTAGIPRNFTLTGQCGIAGTAQAVSLNVTVANPSGPGFILIYPQGGVLPTVSTLNYTAGQVVANAAVVPLGGGGAITVVAGVSGTDLILDTNGYYDASGLITQISPGTGLAGGGTSGNVTLGIAAGGVTGTELATGSVTAGKVASGQLVKSVNGLFDNVTLSAGSNVTITPSGNTLTIASSAGSGPPSGPAGGSLSGTYPNPGIANGAVTDAKVTGPISYFKIGGATDGGVFFSASGTLSQDVPNLFWDLTHHRLGLGTTTPGQQLELTGMMTIPDTAASSGTPTAGVLYVGSHPFLHNFTSNINAQNTFVGPDAGNFTNAGYHNTAVGSQAMRFSGNGFENTAVGGTSLFENSGVRNTAVGWGSLNVNTVGSGNVGVGAEALFNNSTADGNTAIGSSALRLQTFSNSNTEWYSGNTAIGNVALTNNQPISVGTGIRNTAAGASSLEQNLTGYENTSAGYSALKSNTAGFQNTAVGSNAGNQSGASTGYGGGAITYVPITTGSFNTFVGVNTGATADSISNCTAVGIDAYCDASNEVRLGNIFVSSIGGKVAWSALSDARAKKEIADLDLGLDFVLKLRPVAYKLKTGNDRTDMGFLAQDVEALLGDQYNVLTVGGDVERTLSLRYTDLIAPLVKAVQEQQRTIAEQRRMLDEERESNRTLAARLAEIERRMGEKPGNLSR